MTNFEQDEAHHEALLHQRFQQLLAEGQQITARIEQLASSAQPKPMDGARFDLLLQKLRQEEAENQAGLEQVMSELQALETTG